MRSHTRSYFIVLFTILPVVSFGQKYNFSGIYVHEDKGKPRIGDTINESYTIWIDSFKHSFTVLGKKKSASYNQYGTWKIYKQNKEETVDKKTNKSHYFERLYMSMNKGQLYGRFEYAYIALRDFDNPKRRGGLCFISNDKIFLK